MENYFIYLIIVLVIAFIIFLILRELNCWYWKVNKRIVIMEEQNVLLKRILLALDPSTNTKIITNSSISTSDSSSTSNTKPEVADVQFVYENLSENEKKRVDEFLNFGLKPGQILAIHKVKRTIDRFDPQEWKNVLNKFQENDWLIIQRK